MLGVATASAITTTTAHSSRRPNLVSVGTIVWLSSELMFFAALFAMYFTIRSVSLGQGKAWPTLPEGVHLDVPYALVNTIVLVLSSVTCQLGVWAAEKGQVRKLRFWYVISFLMGAWFVGGQLYEYHNLFEEGVTLSSNAYGSVFFLTTGFHGLHVTGGLIAFLFMLGRTYSAKRFTHEQATSAIVVSYYWHFVDVVWIGLFATIYIIK
ncbi:aa3-type cytochrome oxidase subunit III [Sphaerisporangium corydalis]|uniref:cytochrome-c oxidase n=1 Tax=Sphaerisporangium corydalis TaxID=1441875 RepID=A0ABV9EQK4_9ACTN|nr:heme-copper oxidase subunit III [Sphaerisporangium corydalis]